MVSSRCPFILDTYKNDLVERIMIYRIFVDNASLFSKIIDTRNSQNALNSDLKSIGNWLQNMKYNLILILRSKLLADFISSWKSNTYTYPPVTFNNNIITTCPHQKHLGVASMILN